MDYKFLNKVIDQIVYETIMDYDMEEIQFPFLSAPPSFLFLFFPSSPLILFSKHCRDVYGLNDDEVKYVWVEYIQIIKDKLKNNG